MTKDHRRDDEGAEKVRATQFAVASDTNAAVLRVKQSIADVENPTELWNAEMTWAIANSEKSGGYWRSLFDAANETNVKICNCLSEQAQTFGAQEVTAGPAHSAPRLGGQRIEEIPGCMKTGCRSFGLFD